MLKVIYEPGGRAKEYSPWAANLYRGCGHGCTYCYAPKALQISNVEFGEPKPRVDIIKKLLGDCTWLRKQGLHYKVLLCFSCDPYQPIDTYYKLTRQAIEIIKHNNLGVVILTKGGERAERDFDLLTNGDQFGVTLTCVDDAESLKWEPGATLPDERINSLKKAHDLGIKTWVSLEPVVNPEATLELIKRTHQFVDLFKVGKMN